MSRPSPGTDPVSAVFDRYAADYAERFNRNPLARRQRERVHRVLARHVPRGATVLDAGCGPGSDFAFYREQAFRVTAIDPSREMVAAARRAAAEAGLPALLHVCGALDYRAPDTFDAIVLNFGVLNAVPDAAAVLAHLAGALHPQGRLIATVMPPLHAWYHAGLLLRGRAGGARDRLAGCGETREGMPFRYLRRRDFGTRLRVVERRHLGWLLPTPEQHSRHRIARLWTTLADPLDTGLAGIVPEWAGGDHVCYVLAPQ